MHRRWEEREANRGHNNRGNRGNRGKVSAVHKTCNVGDQSESLTIVLVMVIY